MAQDKITLVTDDFTGPAISETFKRELRALDPTLLIRWNPRRMRFVIEQCTEHHAPGPEHDHLCARIYVLLVQDPEGGMMSPSSATLEQIKARDVTKAGYGPGDLQRWTKERADEDAETRKTIERKQREAVKHASAYGRRQLLQAFQKLSRMGTPNR